jgi:predicted NUDIX family NTP pyrophosphohydrolase
MTATSAGLLMFRRSDDGLQVLLAHPGGPYFRKADLGAWTVPKGLIQEDEDPLTAARREFSEETGYTPSKIAVYHDLGTIRQKGGKQVRAWGFEDDWDPARLHSNTFRLEWPPRSGRFRDYPEIDRAEWFGLEEGCRRINPAQIPFLERLSDSLAESVQSTDGA